MTRRVLIVDDEPRLRALLSRSVTRMGFEPEAVGSAEEARDSMRREAAHIVLLDLRLPGTQGGDFLDELGANWPQAQVVIVTGFGDLQVAQKAIRHQVADFVTKPFTLDDISRAIGRATARLGQAPSNADQHRSIANLEREAIENALVRHAGNRTAAAQDLGITRRTLYSKIKQYDLG